MRLIPVTQKSATAGSNLRGKQLAKYRAEAFAKIRKPLERLSREYERATKKLFSKAERRTATEIAKRVRHAYHTANLKLGPNSRKWEANRVKFKAALRRELARSLPNYRAWQALAKAHRRDYRVLVGRALTALVDRRVHIDFDDVLPPDSGETYVFTPPFPIHDTNIEYDDDAEVEDLSVTVPDKGYLVNRIDFDQTYQPLIPTDLYKFNWFARHRSATSCGINFTTPASGHLRVRAKLQNFYNNIVVSLRDDWGLSEGAITVEVRLVIVIDRPNQIIELATTLVSDGTEAEGEDTVYQFPSLDSTTPYVFEATTDEVFPANTGLRIMAGIDVRIVGEIDDMTSHADVIMGWELQKIVINIV